MFYNKFSKVTSKTAKSLSSKEIRQLFLEFFIKQNDHKFIKSSPIVPFCDPTLAFVNAGMNQFKSIFLGKMIPTHKKVANSQKCVRVGGKHNDISIVGKDGYHHTFFEMLGNWSFGDYFKEEACTMALEFLRDTLEIHQSRLYVTYFGGDEKLNIPADRECFEIWQSLGFQKDRILPFGANDNFWEMGLTGPCGTCTEIHIDHLPYENSLNRAKYVNTGRDDLTELWNLVFIEYNRNADNSIIPLPQRHVDTGMGMERLTAIIQGKRSNYDTDLFLPIIETIEKVCKSPQYKGILQENDENYALDIAYRILADHSRMITACLSDGMLPDQNQKLRRVIRTSLSLSENTFHNENLLNETIPIVVEILGSTYPEINQKYENVLDIVNNEKEIFKALKQNSSKDIQEILIKYPKLNEFDFTEYPGFINAFKELQQEKKSFNNQIIPGKFLFKLHDTYGLNDNVIEQLAEIENLQLDLKGFKLEILNAKQKTKKLIENTINNENQQNYWKLNESIIEYTLNCSNTDDNFKYSYEFDKIKNKYNVPEINAKILGIFENGNVIQSVDSNTKNVIGIVTDKSNFYSESGGQESDCGIIKINGTDIVFNVENIEKINDCIIHIGKFIVNNSKNHRVNVNDNVNLIVDETHRTFNTIHHTGTHLLNAAVHNLFKKVVYQISSSVTSEYLKLELGIIGKKLILDDVILIENLLKQVISSAIPVKVSIKNASEILEMTDVITVPGEIYPEFNLRLLEIKDNQNNFISKELCCGTHALNTNELNEFCITNFKQTSRARYAFTAVCGNLAKEVINTSEEYMNQLNRLEKIFKSNPDHFDVIENDLKKLRNILLHSNVILSYVLKVKCLNKINEFSKTIKELSRSNLKNFIEMEMTNILQERPKEAHPFIIHFLKCSSFMENVPLQKATKLCSDRPIIVVSLDDGKIKARCCVPKDKISDKFSAIIWLKEFADIFKGQISPPKGQNPDEVCNMKAKKVLTSIFDDQLDLATKKAREFALKNL